MIGLVILFLLFLAAVIGALYWLQRQPSAVAANVVSPANITPQQCALRTTLRHVFTDHAVYTKFVLTDILSGATAGQTTADTQRLLRNQHDIGDVVAPIIGAGNAQQLTTLLVAHIQDAAASVVALKQGDAARLEEAKQVLMANADQVGAFLSSLNPAKLPLATTQAMFRQHNRYVLGMAVAQHDGQYERGVILFDEYYSHMMRFSDVLYKALV